MDELANFLTSTVPWLLPLLVAVIGVLFVFLILTFPAYFIFWPFLQVVKTRLVAFRTSLWLQCEGVSKNSLNRLDVETSEFLEDSGLTELGAKDEGGWSAQVGKLAHVISEQLKHVKKSARSLANLESRIASFQLQAESNTHGFPNLAGTQEMLESAGHLRVAWMRSVIAGIILLGLMIVNTGMLSQILRELGVVPVTMMFVGLPLAYVFAFILTLVEAGLGIAHGATKEEESEKLSLFPVFMLLFAIVIAVVEGFFYSRVAPTSGTFTLPFLDYVMLQSTLFFLWGFVLVMTLFSLGSIGYKACVIILKGNSSTALRRLAKIYKRYANALQQVGTESARAKQTLQGSGAHGESVRQQLDAIFEKLNQLTNIPQQGVQHSQRKLTRSDVHQLTQTAGLWLALLVMGLVGASITARLVLAAAYQDMDRTMLWIVAVGLAMIFSAVGVLLGTGSTIVRNDEYGQKVILHHRSSQLAGYIIGVALICAYVLLYFAVALPIGKGTLLLANLLSCLFLTAAAREVTQRLNVLRLWIFRLRIIVIRMLQVLIVSIVWLLVIATIILEYCFYLLAMPVETFVRRRWESKESVKSQDSQNN